MDFRTAVLWAAMSWVGSTLAADAAPLPLEDPQQDTVTSGDMLLFTDRLARAVPPEHPERSGAIAFDFYSAVPWPRGELPVVFGDDVTLPLQDQFFAACSVWAAHTGVRCIRRTDERKHILVSGIRRGCASTVGAPVFGDVAVMNVDGACFNERVLLHELGHAFGLIHEHQRVDRDEHVEVHPENAYPEYVYAFDRLATSRPLSAYELRSMMHYTWTDFSANGKPTIVPRPQYGDEGTWMGSALRPLAGDRQALAAIYNLPPAPRTDDPPVPVPAPAFSRADILRAMEDLDAVYVEELGRPAGLSINGKPDFLGIAAWIFDVYLSGRASGYTQGESFYIVRAAVSQTEEWRLRNPGRAPLTAPPTTARIPVDRGEYLDAMHRLDEAYRTELGRPEGLSFGTRPDFQGVAAWIFDVYLNARLAGRTADDAWASVLAGIRDTDEYRRRH